MAESISILKKSLTSYPPALDFDFLNTEGIKYLQQLAGSVWTDYNEHDPGVTILEQLCYAITDLAYRTGYDIKDIIETGQANVTGDGNKDHTTFYTAKDALTCNPLTITDINKYIIDRVEEVVHAWAEVAESKDGYIIKVETREGIDSQIIEKKVYEAMNECRNLCEQVKKVIIYEPQYITLTGDIDLEDTADVSEVMGDIFYQVNYYLSHNVRFYTLREMLDAGYTVEEIFRGPVLERGFIMDSEMVEKRSVIYYSKLTAVILNVPGVKSVRRLLIDGGGDYSLSIPEGKIAVLDVNSSSDSNPYQLLLYKGDIRYAPDPDTVQKKYRSLTARNTRRYSKLPDNLRDTQRPRGTKRNISYYHSIQHNFPRIYGIEAGGVPESFPALRKVQARQLKAYLLFFEQLIADFLEQLENVKEIFSISRQIEKTYYSRDLNKKVTTITAQGVKQTDIIPDLEKYKLLKKEIPRTGNRDIYKCISPATVPAGYSTGIKTIVNELDNFIDRRNRVANHLLARFGERVTGKLLIQFNTYYPEKEFRKNFINYKLDFLQNIPELGANRAKGYDISQAVWGTRNFAGLEKRVSLLLGMNDSYNTFSHSKHSLTDTVLREHIWFRKEKYSGIGGTKFIRPVATDMKADELSGLMSVEENDASLNTGSSSSSGEFYHRPKGTYIDEDILKGGFDIKRFKYGVNKTDIGKRFIVVYDLQENQAWRQVGEYDTKAEAEHTIRYLANYLRRLNIDSEGFHLIEHPLLKVTENEGVGVEITGYSGVLLQSAFRYDEDLFKKVAEEIIVAAHHYHNYVIYEDVENGHLIQLMDKERVLAIHPRWYTNHNEAKAALDEVFSSMERLHRDEVEKGFRVKKYTEDRTFIKVPGDFYPFTITIVLPDWPARFRNNEFRKLVVNTFRANAPAHIKINHIWLNVFELRDFENLYIDWLKEMRKQKNTEELYRLSAELTWMLHKYIGRERKN